MELLQIKDLSFKYPKASNKTLNKITAEINSGDFVLLCGATGSGKTTLLKMLKKEITPFGEKSGTVLFDGKDISKTFVGDIGYVMQNPENQIVCDKVWHELAFGLENLGINNTAMRIRVAEIASYFGISDWFNKDTCELSGGQKQLLNLASVMVMRPRLLLLDEPTSQLDPMASIEFINTLKRLNADFGTTIIMTEHRTDEVFSLANKLMIIDNGTVTAFGLLNDVCSKVRECSISGLFPSAVRIWQGTGAVGQCAVNSGECRNYIVSNFKNTQTDAEIREYKHFNEVVLECKSLCFRYNKNSDDVIDNLNLKVHKGEVLCVIGANGSGKTTLVKLIGGVLKQYKGEVKINGKNRDSHKDKNMNSQKTSILPQNVQTVFLKDSVMDDLKAYCDALGFEENEKEARIAEITQRLRIEHLIDKHPFDLSGGEQQKCAIAKLLLSKPQILIMDEPVKSLDSFSKDSIAEIINALSAGGMSVIIVTHDIDFAASVADRCALLFDGEMVSSDIPQRFFSDNSFYTTAASRISRNYYNYAIRNEDVIKLCLENGRKE